jgi:hypothetical protein
MNQQYSVLFYSQYSPNCKRILSLIESSSIDFSSLLNLSNVCIDNVQIRNRILKSKNIKINSVPCILTIYPDGGVEKYEGSHTFNWVEEIIDKYNKINNRKNNVTFQENNRDITPTISFNENVRDVRDERMNIQQPIENKVYNRVGTKSVVSVISPSPRIDKSTVISRRGHQLRWPAQPDPIDPDGGIQPSAKSEPTGLAPRGKTVAPSGKTLIKIDEEESDVDTNINKEFEEIETIEEIEAIENNEEKKPVNIRMPPKSIRSDSGNYELGVDFGAYEEPTREIKKGIKSSTQAVSNTKSDILSAAQAMQKSREMDIENSRPPGMPKE